MNKNRPINSEMDIKQHQAQQRRAELNRMVELFKEEDAKPILIKASEFKRYERLFSLEERKKLPTYTQDQLEELSQLSRDFSSIVNLYKPFSVIDDNTNEVLFTIPAQLRPLSLIRSEEGKQAIDIVRNLQETAFDQPWKTQAAMHNLITQVIANQKDNDFRSANREFLEQSKQLHDSGVLASKIVAPGVFIKNNNNNTNTSSDDASKNNALDEDTSDGLEDIEF